MEFFKSIGSLSLGVLKRLYYLIPSLFSDPFDVIERWFKVIYEPPQWMFWLLVIVGLAIAIILAYHEVRMQKVKFEKSYPRIAVRPYVSEDKRLILEITNDGFGGDFSAKVKIRKGSPITDLLDLQWETSGQVCYHIDGGGGEATLLVGALPKVHQFNATDQKSPTLLHTGELQLFTMKQGRPIMIRLYEIKYDVGKDAPPDYECELEVTITSEPTLRNPFKRKLYSIRLKGLDLSFSERSNS